MSADGTANASTTAPPRGAKQTYQTPLQRLAKGAWHTLLIAGILALILGIMTLVWPGPTLLVAGIFFGAYLLVTGIAQLIAAFGTHTTAAMRVLAFVSGALSILLGLLCFRSALQSILLLAIWIGIGWLIRGITETVAAIQDEDMPARGWQIALGIISVLGGVVLLVSPFESIAVLTIVAGAWLVAMGIMEIVTALKLRHDVKTGHLSQAEVRNLRAVDDAVSHTGTGATGTTGTTASAGTTVPVDKTTTAAPPDEGRRAA
ncbi:HdeD family acid-resistance protein [Streptomyces sp. A7024]|uniref:HdeD family acid-resistance protein n=1 Tax=Streptomyces coryli TaxID=1128680 RepID=A0A6G4TWH1_9ACTN|nr:HdeD family acid-resistance protein [Streptomyces coryli]